MMLTELGRYYWARSNQASYMEGALRCHKQRNDEVVLYCLLNWAYYMDIADELQDKYGHEFDDVIRQSRGIFRCEQT